MSIVHWLIVLLVIGLWGWIIYLAVTRVRDERKNGQGITAGFKGWLLVFTVFLSIGAFRSLLEFAKAIADIDPQVADRFPALIVCDVLTATIGLGTIVASVWLLWTKSRAFRRMFVATAVWAIVSVPLSAFVAGVVLSIYDVDLTENQHVRSMLAETAGRWVVGSIGTGLWLLYVLRSRRVAATCIN